MGDDSEHAGGDGLTPRSYSAHEVGQQLYAVIESCSSLKTLWAKVDSGHYDWLGVQESRGRRVFILGRPRQQRGGVTATGSAVHAEAAPGEHGVEIRTPHATLRGVTSAWFKTGEEARAEYDKRLQELTTEGPGSALYRLTLVVDHLPVQTKVVARVLPNRL